MSDQPQNKGTPARGASMVEFLESLEGDTDLKAFHIPLRLKLARFGERVRAARKRWGWTQKDLAAAAGLTQAKISAIEAGTMAKGPTFDTFQQLAEVLRDPDLLVLDLPETKPPVCLDARLVARGGALLRDAINAALPLRDPVVAAGVGAGAGAVVAVRLVNETIMAERVREQEVTAYFPDGHVEIDGIAAPITGQEIAADVNATRNYLVMDGDNAGAVMAINVLKG